MTQKQLSPEQAVRFAIARINDVSLDFVDEFATDKRIWLDGYEAGARSRDEEIAELKRQVEYLSKAASTLASGLRET